MFYSLSVFRIPAGSYPNIESRDSPLGGSCNYVDETDPKLAYKKSVFKKKSTSSTATVRKQKYVFALENKVFILLCQRKRAIFSIVTPITHNTHSFYYLRVWLKGLKVPWREEVPLAASLRSHLSSIRGPMMPLWPLQEDLEIGKFLGCKWVCF